MRSAYCLFSKMYPAFRTVWIRFDLSPAFSFFLRKFIYTSITFVFNSKLRSHTFSASATRLTSFPGFLRKNSRRENSLGVRFRGSPSRVAVLRFLLALLYWYKGNPPDKTSFVEIRQIEEVDNLIEKIQKVSPEV